MESVNIELMRDGTIRVRRSYKTFAGMVRQLETINRRYLKMGVSGDFTVRLPLKPGAKRARSAPPTKGKN